MSRARSYTGEETHGVMYERKSTGKFVKNTKLIAIIGDEDTVTGFLLGGIGDSNEAASSSSSTNIEQSNILNLNAIKKEEFKEKSSSGGGGSCNFLIVDKDTEISTIDECFKSFVERKDIGIILICQYIADKIRETVDSYGTVTMPTILEIPSKEHPYDPEKDSTLKRARIVIEEGCKFHLFKDNEDAKTLTELAAIAADAIQGIIDIRIGNNNPEDK